MSQDALANRPKESLVKEVRSRRERDKKERAQAGVKLGFEALMAGVGGAVAGIADDKYPNIRGTGIPASAPIGVAVLAIAMSGYGGRGRNAQLMGELGKGCLAVAASKKSVEAWKKLKK